MKKTGIFPGAFAAPLLFIVQILILSFLFSCASKDEVATTAPSWAYDEVRVNEDSYLFTAVGRGANKEDALKDLARALSGKVLKQMGFSEDDFADFPEERAYLTDLFAAFLAGDESLIPGGHIEDLAWFQDGEELACAVRFRYDMDNFDQAREDMRIYLSGGNDYFRLMKRAAELEEEGYFFSAFLYDMDAAREGRETGGLLSGYLLGSAFGKASDNLNRTDVPVLEGADQIYLGARRSWPYRIMIPLSPEENQRIPWTVSMTIPLRGGKEDVLPVALPSERDGGAVLSYPFPSGTGTGIISFSLFPGGEYDPLFENLSSLETEAGRLLKSSLSRFHLVKSIPIVRDRKVLRTALVIEDRDVAGRLLNTRTTEESVFTVLTGEGYTVARENLDLEKLRSLSELEMIRELNSHYGNNYDIILFSEAGIRNFSQKGDLYQMNAGAVLYEADLWEQRINVIEEVTVSVSGGDPTRLVTSAFFQLGKDISEACLKLKDN
ncbi:MAG: hypothetical protein JXA95_18300 [Spirochaetales bacterium]|nr:hypothetical protein [Spirochaetales bacterium]